MTIDTPPLLPTLHTCADLLAAGYTRSGITDEVRSGRLVRVRQGVFVDARLHAALSPDAQYRQAVRAAATKSPQLVVSHESALALHALPILERNPDQVSFTRVRSSGTVRQARRVIYGGPLEEGDIQVMDGIRVTSPARTLMDVARTGTFTAGVAAMDTALRLRTVTRAEMTVTMKRLAHRSGLPQARRVLAFADDRAESAGESFLRCVVAEQGLPMPELQVQIHDKKGKFVGRADLTYVNEGVVLEFDGAVKYQGAFTDGKDLREVILAERERERRLIALGYIVLRFTWAELHSPAMVAGRVTEALQLGRHLRSQAPCAGSVIRTLTF